MTKLPRLSKQLWELGLMGVMGLVLVAPSAFDLDGEEALSEELLLDYETDALDYQDHRELFNGPTSLANSFDEFDDLELLDSDAVHVTSEAELHEELGDRVRMRGESIDDDESSWRERWSLGLGESWHDDFSDPSVA